MQRARREMGEVLTAEITACQERFNDVLTFFNNEDLWNVKFFLDDTKKAIVAAIKPAQVAPLKLKPQAQLPKPFTPKPALDVIGGINGPQQKILDAIATFVAANVPARIEHIANFCGTTKRAGGSRRTSANSAQAAPQEARSVFPNALSSKIMMSCNLRSWRHFFLMRTSKEAHPQMRQVTIPLLAEFQRLAPVLFEDIVPESRPRGAGNR